MQVGILLHLLLIQRLKLAQLLVVPELVLEVGLLACTRIVLSPRFLILGLSLLPVRVLRDIPLPTLRLGKLSVERLVLILNWLAKQRPVAASRAIFLFLLGFLLRFILLKLLLLLLLAR